MTAVLGVSVHVRRTFWGGLYHFESPVLEKALIIMEVKCLCNIYWVSWNAFIRFSNDGRDIIKCGGITNSNVFRRQMLRFMLFCLQMARNIHNVYIRS